ncbi:hypothetical protein TNCV_4376161 [Trichonephila clavipes]|nr:hypothetical protein TNCV_4376161 [Trichonephila clavipes]
MAQRQPSGTSMILFSQMYCHSWKRAIFQQENARPDASRMSQDCFHLITTLPWPARSPDLSPIKHIRIIWEGKLDSLRVCSNKRSVYGNCGKRDVSVHQAELLCLNAYSYRIVHSR